MFLRRESFNRIELIRAVRLSIAILLGNFLVWLVGLHHSIWLLVTVIVVLFDQTTVGGALQRGLFRIIATVLSGVVGFLTLYFFHDNQLANLTVIILGTFIYSYYFMDSKQSYIGVLGATTLVMVIMFANGDVYVPILRATEIILGVMVSIISMIVFFPSYASNQRNHLLIDIIDKLQLMLEIFIDKTISLQDLHNKFAKFEAKYIGEIVNYSRVIDESKFEPYVNKAPFDYARVLLQLRRVHRLFAVLMHHINDDQIRTDEEVVVKIKLIIAVFLQIKIAIKNDLSQIGPIKLNNVEIELQYRKAEANFIIVLIHRINNEITQLLNIMRSGDA